jgi:hypothetical protein
MPRRVASLLLSLAMVLGGTAAAQCVGHAACLAALQRPMDCCAAKNGISNPSCCEGKQVRRDAGPVTPDRPVQSSLAAPAAQVAPFSPLREPVHGTAAGQSDAGAAPPGGSLIAQHTSLLL